MRVYIFNEATYLLPHYSFFNFLYFQECQGLYISKELQLQNIRGNLDYISYKWNVRNVGPLNLCPPLMKGLNSQSTQ